MRNKEMKNTTGGERNLSLILVIPMYIWIANNIIKGIVSIFQIPLYIQYAEGIEIVGCLNPFLKFTVAASFILILNLKKSGLYMLLPVALFYFIINIIVEGLPYALVSMSFAAIFFILFFTVKKDGRTAYQVIFDKCK